MPADSSSATRRASFLLVANYDSNVGYAWWLMESFWVALASQYASSFSVVLAYPSISVIPNSVARAPLSVVEQDFHGTAGFNLISRLRFLYRHRVRALYLTDAPAWNWRYLMYRLAGVRVIIVHDHTPGRRRVSSPWLLWAKTALHRFRILSADALIAVTPFVSKRHVEVVGFPIERCFVAENGVPVEEQSDITDIHAKFHIPATRRVLVAVGRAHPIKGIDLVLEALSLLIVGQGRTDLHFLYCGDGPQLPQLQSQAERLGISNHVTFAGRQHPIMPLLRGCDLAIHASRAEVGYSLSVLEFMLARLPLVVSDDESVSGAVEHGVSGLTFSTGDSHSAAAAIAQILDDQHLASSLAEAAHLRVRNRYTLARTHQQLIAAVTSILRDRGLDPFRIAGAPWKRKTFE